MRGIAAGDCAAAARIIARRSFSLIDLVRWPLSNRHRNRMIQRTIIDALFLSYRQSYRHARLVTADKRRYAQVRAVTGERGVLPLESRLEPSQFFVKHPFGNVSTPTGEGSAARNRACLRCPDACAMTRRAGACWPAWRPVSRACPARPALPDLPRGAAPAASLSCGSRAARTMWPNSGSSKEDG